MIRTMTLYRCGVIYQVKDPKHFPAMIIKIMIMLMSIAKYDNDKIMPMTKMTMTKYDNDK